MRHPERGQRPACFMGRGCVREGRVYLDGYGVVSLRQRAGGVPLALFIVPLQEGCGKFPAGRTKFRPPDELGSILRSLPTSPDLDPSNLANFGGVGPAGNFRHPLCQI